jgi:hypothetical protein
VILELAEEERVLASGADGSIATGKIKEAVVPGVPTAPQTPDSASPSEGRDVVCKSILGEAPTPSTTDNQSCNLKAANQKSVRPPMIEASSNSLTLRQLTTSKELLTQGREPSTMEVNPGHDR